MNIISHPAENGKSEKLLTDHLKNVAENSKKQIMSMGLNLSPDLIDNNKLAELSYIIGLFHDFGKFTKYFQDYIYGKIDSCSKTHHSFISALMTYLVLEEIGFSEVLCAVAYLVVMRHHGSLKKIDVHDLPIKNVNAQIESIKSFSLEEIKLFYQEQSPIKIKDIEKKLDELSAQIKICLNEDGLIFIRKAVKKIKRNKNNELYFISNLLFSVLIDNDKRDAARLMEDSYFEGNLDEPVNDVFEYIDKLRKEDPKKFDINEPLNQARNEFLNTIRNCEYITAGKHFYEITAPTGIGKTFGSLVFANKLKEKLPKGKGRIIYCLPYTSIIDQNYKVFEEIIAYSKKDEYNKRPTRYLLKHHYLANKEVKNRIDDEDYNYNDYLDDRLFVESWEASMVVSTFVQFFHTIVGYKNRMLKKFHNIVGSIVILDEVQNIPERYHFLLQEVLDILGERFNMYFLLMTATQPNILKKGAVKIVDANQFMRKDVFNRVKLTVKTDKMSLEEFGNYFSGDFNDDNVLVVMNTKRSAFEFYNILKDNKKFDDYKKVCLTTLLIPKDRRKYINSIKQELKDGTKLIVVSTQLVEAGVDVSFKKVYRDFGPLDSVIQVAGRCNRNGEFGELGGEMQLVRLLTGKGKEYSNFIYSPTLIQWTGDALEKDKYESINFVNIAKKYFAKFNSKGISNDLLEEIKKLDYDKIKDDFELIEDNYATEDIYVLTSENAQEKMDRMLDLRDRIFKGGSDCDNKRWELEKIKNELRQYMISLGERDLEKIKDCFDDEGKYIKYIRYENASKVYSLESGIDIFSDKNHCGAMNV